jgi:uncharacterized protein YidB (DUF937 family)
MDIIQLGTQLLGNRLSAGGNPNNDSIAAVLNMLIGSGQKADIAGMVAQMQSGGLGSLVASWLGDGENSPISSEQVREAIGNDKIAQAAGQLDTDEESLLKGLSEALPTMVDKSSRGGSLLDAIGGIDGAMNMAKKLF